MYSFNLELVRERQRTLLREAAQERLATEIARPVPLAQRAGETLMKLGAQLALKHEENCVRVETRTGQVVTGCPA
ncbi:hypothetical protein FBR02_02540 [Anaerolineae bacterium CFX9]|jgi:hypothetical protein|nr:hypothetical protein [Anaerolineae bacterium CFX9]